MNKVTETTQMCDIKAIRAQVQYSNVLRDISG